MCMSGVCRYTAQCNVNTHTLTVTAKLDEDDPAKMSLSEKMKMFNSKLTHKPPVAGLPKPKEEKGQRISRLRTMPVLASQVQEAMEQNERLTQSLTHDDLPRNPDFQLKMELFRSASAKNTSLEYLMKQNAKFRSLGLVLFLYFAFDFFWVFLLLVYCALSGLLLTLLAFCRYEHILVLVKNM